MNKCLLTKKIYARIERCEEKIGVLMCSDRPNSEIYEARYTGEVTGLEHALYLLKQEEDDD